jgi:hypothetical protein
VTARFSPYSIELFRYVRESYLGRARHRWVDNIKMDLREIRWDDKNWIDLAHDSDQGRALVNTEMKLRVP